LSESSISVFFSSSLMLRLYHCRLGRPVAPGVHR
jgi:hypothetical protein